jgi:ribonucleotide monophosphatase NagD (HAD superfamily)
MIVPDIDDKAEIYCFDLDGTLCTEENCNLADAKPILSRISIVNRLYEKGAKIYLMTARGMLSSDNNAEKADKLMRDLTEKQLKEWGVQYHQLFFGKPRAAYYIDDKGWSDADFFRQF